MNNLLSLDTNQSACWSEISKLHETQLYDESHLAKTKSAHNVIMNPTSSIVFELTIIRRPQNIAFHFFCHHLAIIIIKFV